MRIKHLRVSAELLAQFLKAPVAPGLTSEGVPVDLRIVNAKWEDCGTILLTVASETFPIVTHPDYIENMTPLFCESPGLPE